MANKKYAIVTNVSNELMSICKYTSDIEQSAFMVFDILDDGVLLSKNRMGATGKITASEFLKAIAKNFIETD